MTIRIPPRLFAHPICLVGAPNHFSLRAELRNTKELFIANAFVHMSGWTMIRSSILESSAKVTLITGLDFCQSEPEVLRDWIGPEFRQRAARAYLYIGTRTFHPKVFLIETSNRSFVLIGSANLSAGGLRNNVECLLYSRESRHVGQMRAWFREITSDHTCYIPLSSPDIDEYEQKWLKASKARNRLNSLTAKATRNITNSHKATMSNWANGVSEAKKYFASSEFDWYDDQKRAAKKILVLLKHPTFTFDKIAWHAFYDIWHMGHLVPINRDRVWKQRNRLQAGLRALADEFLPVASRMDTMLDSSRPSYVKDLGINAVSKILACINPKRWPVWNGPVKAAVKAFGYKSPKGGTIGQKYEAFAELMSDFLTATGAPDMLALDCFFCWKGKK